VKLLPCPECGKQPKLSSLFPKHPDRKYFCGVHISCGDWKHTLNEAKEDWNRRVGEYQESLNKVELKSCPFCGYGAVLEPMKVRKGYEAVVHCNGCLASIHTITYDTEEDAVLNATSAWNRRK
jgi:Lar family restriction alleviation protein